MFSLIISIIAIALVIVLAGASLYYGGEAFNQGTAKGEAAKMLNEGQQISGGYTMHKVDTKGAVPANVTELFNDEYLAVDLSADSDGDGATTDEWTIGTGASTVFNGEPVVAKEAPSQDVCNAIVDASNSQATCFDNAGTLTVEYRL